MDAAALKKLFEQVKRGKLSPDEAVERLRHLPFEDLGFANVDHHRALRTGMPEIIFGPGKTPPASRRDFCAAGGAWAQCFGDAGLAGAGARGEAQVSQSGVRMNWRGPSRLRAMRRFTARARSSWCRRGPVIFRLRKKRVVTAQIMGNEVQHVYDVGVAGIHRLLARRDVLTEARVIIVCAGMEGALPSVVGGLVGVPVIAVPTSVGYGASYKGIAALLGMLNSCASNVTVVNIDNGFGAGYVASVINRLE